jgi:hypothetical protein
MPTVMVRCHGRRPVRPVRPRVCPGAAIGPGSLPAPHPWPCPHLSARVRPPGLSSAHPVTCSPAAAGGRLRLEPARRAQVRPGKVSTV